MDHNTIKKYETISKEYFGVPRHRQLRQGQLQNNIGAEKYSFIVDKFNKEDNIVDVGCGGGYFKGIFPNLIAFDLVDYGNQDYVSNILDAPIPEGSQDGVFCFGVLHECPDEYHLPNIEKMLTWLKPNGQLVMRCKAQIVVNKHPIQRYAITDLYQKYNEQGMWSRERIDQFTNILNLKLNWVEHKVVTRKQQWAGARNNLEVSDNSVAPYDSDVMFDGHLWSWSKKD